jgi:uncharacterized protein
MGARTHYAPGVFCWVELESADPDATTAFYGRLFGWTADEEVVPEEYGGGTYTTLRLDGDAVAGLQQQPEPQREAGVPPHWLSCVSVTDADATASRAEALGGTVHTVYDAGSHGRMAIIADPTGAFLGAWQAGDMPGAARVNDPGCLTMNELNTDDMDAASAFYQGLFGWRIEEIDTGGGPRYWSVRHEGAAGDGLNGGGRLLAPEQEGVPPHWIPYFTVASIDDPVATAADAGGTVLAGPIQLPTGSKVAVAADPDRAVFALFEGRVDD